MRAARALAEDSHHTIFVAGSNSVLKQKDGKFVPIYEPQPWMPTSLGRPGRSSRASVGGRGERPH